MADIYEDFDRATASVQAYAIMKGKDYIGRCVIRRKTAVTAYFQLWGAAMQKGIARGGNYDMGTAAVEAAVAKLDDVERLDGNKNRATIQEIMADPAEDGVDWKRRLEHVGFQLLLVI